MAYLILDTETNGLNHLTDSVIEIGGVIANFDIITNRIIYQDSYHSLVNNNNYLEQKIIDITGITADQLKTAPKLNQVQEEWQSFIAKYNITHIFGHSLIFDTSFLASNGFFLPQAIHIDTLDMLKIVALDIKALNLDYINRTYNLNKYFTRPQELETLSHHRALYDAFLAGGLINFVFSVIEENRVSTDFVIAYQDFFGEKFSFITDTKKVIINNNSKKDVRVNCLKQDVGIDTKAIFTKLLENNEIYYNINELYNKTSSKKTFYKKIILSIWFGLLNTDKLKRINLNGSIEKKFFDITIKTLGYKLEEINQGYALEYPEEIINNNSSLTTRSLSTLDITDYLEIYCDTFEIDSTIKGSLRLAQARILSSLRVITNTSYYSLNKSLSTFEHTDLINALDNLKNISLEFLEVINNSYSKGYLVEEIIRYLKEVIMVLQKNELSFFFHDGDVKIYTNYDFDISEYLRDLIKQAKSIKTTLLPKEYLDFLEIFAIEENKDVEYGRDIYELQDSIKNNSLMEYLGLEKNVCKVIFLGKSAHLKSFPSKLKNEDIDYIDVSNVGSATKILSKIENGYKGVVILSYKSIEFLANFYSLDDVTKLNLEFIFYSDIFLPLTKSIKNCNTKGTNQFEFDKAIAKLYLKFLLYKIYIKFNTKIKLYNEF